MDVRILIRQTILDRQNSVNRPRERNPGGEAGAGVAARSERPL